MIDCIIGAAVGYNREQIRPFLKSLRATGYQKRVILFATKGAAKEAQDWDADVRTPPPVKTLPHAERFYWIQEALAQISCNGVLCCDTRDVIFQKNPDLMKSNGFHAYEEDRCMTIGTCPYNSDWVDIGYGETELDRLRNFPISCVGTFCGSREHVAAHLLKLVHELKRLQHLTTKPQDQSCHNHIIRQRKFSGEIHESEKSEVYTVGYMPRETVRVDEEKILNIAGEVPTVIHQWDRHENLKALVERNYL